MLISEHFFVYCGILTVVDISYCMCFILYLFVFCYVFVLCYGPFVCVLNKEYDNDDVTSTANLKRHIELIGYEDEI